MSSELFDNLQRASLEYVAEGHGGGLAADNRHLLRGLRRVAVDVALSYGIGARNEVADIDRAAGAGDHISGDTVAGNGKGNAGHHTILAGFDQVHGAYSFHLQTQIGADRVRHILAVGNDILNAAALIAVRPGDDAGADAGRFAGGHTDVADYCGVGSDGQRLRS